MVSLKGIWWFVGLLRLYSDNLGKICFSPFLFFLFQTGQILSILLQSIINSSTKFRLVHLSVHDGSIIQSMDISPIDIVPPATLENEAISNRGGTAAAEVGIQMRWWRTGSNWPDELVSVREEKMEMFGMGWDGSLIIRKVSLFIFMGRFRKVQVV